MSVVVRGQVHTGKVVRVVLNIVLYDAQGIELGKEEFYTVIIPGNITVKAIEAMVPHSVNEFTLKNVPNHRLVLHAAFLVDNKGSYNRHRLSNSS
jgi:hypothetical protein